MYSDINTSTIRFHARLGDLGSNTPNGWNCIRLWYGIKSEDLDGTGRWTGTIDHLATKLKVSGLTIRRWLGLNKTATLKDGSRSLNGIELGLFRSVKRLEGDRVTVYYSSVTSVCKRYGIESLGAVQEIYVDQLRHMRTIATEMEIILAQRSSIYQAEKKLKGDTQKARVATPTDVLPSSVYCSGANVVAIGQRVTFLSEQAIPSGASQSGVAETFKRSDRTIRRRLSNKQREKCGLKKIVRRQLAYSSEEFELEYDRIHHMQSNLKSSEFFELVKDSRRLFKFKDRVWKLGCNLYRDLVDLVDCKNARKRLRLATQFP